MVQRVSTVAFEGIEARAVDVQVQVAPGLPAFHVVGLADKAVSEARERVRSALVASGLALPNAPALALSRHGESAGSAAAMLGAVQFGVGAAVSPVVGLLGNDAAAMGTVIVTALLLAIVVLVTVVRPWELTDVPEEPAPAGVH